MQPYKLERTVNTTLATFHSTFLDVYVWRDPFKRLFVDIFGLDIETGHHLPNPLVCVNGINPYSDMPVKDHELMLILNALRMVAGFNDDVAKLTEFVTEHYLCEEMGE